MAGRAAVRRAHGVLVAAGGQQRVDRRRRQPGLIAEHDEHRVGVRERRQPAAQRRRLPLLPVGADHGGGAVEVGARPDLVGRVPEHDHARRHRGHRGERVLEQRPPAQRRELLGGAEPPPGARGQHERGGRHSRPDSISSASASSEAIEFPGSRWSTCGSAACMPRVSGS